MSAGSRIPEELLHNTLACLLFVHEEELHLPRLELSRLWVAARLTSTSGRPRPAEHSAVDCSAACL